MAPCGTKAGAIEALLPVAGITRAAEGRRRQESQDGRWISYPLREDVEVPLSAPSSASPARNKAKPRTIVPGITAFFLKFMIKYSMYSGSSRLPSYHVGTRMRWRIEAAGQEHEIK
jgi:hypothetical protein